MWRPDTASGGVWLVARPQGRTAGRSLGPLLRLPAGRCLCRFDALYGERITEVACWSHARRKVFDIHESTKSSIAADALQKIGELYQIEKALRGRPPDRRRDVRQEAAKPRLIALRVWFEAQIAKLPPKGGLAQAIRYALSNWTALTC